MCAKSKAGFVTHTVIDWLASKKYPKFVTFTVKHTDDALYDQIKHLYDSFRKFRRLREIKKSWYGGVWFFQVIKSEKTSQWHCHLHVITYGKFLHRERLSQLWLKETGDSCVVDIRAVKDPEAAAKYCARYVARPANLKGLTSAEVAELIEGTHGLRTCGCWGKRPHPALNYNAINADKNWQNVGSWSTVVYNRKDLSTARNILYAWLTGTVLPESESMKEIDDFINDIVYLEKETEDAKFEQGDFNWPRDP
jgi:hypothetical protein